MPLSGSAWVTKFPTSVDVADLASPFRENVKRFLAAITAAGGTYDIKATYRPVERAFLMHYAWSIARENLSPAKVPKNPAIDIDWVYRRPNGRIDYTASRKAAQDMVDAYDIAFKPALVSQHTMRLAIDVVIAWTNSLDIVDSRGKTVKITSMPRSGSNRDLIAVGASYHVLKLVSDPPHWSDNGH
ncbi:MAG: hypothetical protein KGS72_04235 [Cyanobacteria bacterium REEB67]|nr:hypothetical protein [Cyanobacteria bacterium REEB67]